MKAVILSNIFILANQIASNLKRKLDIESLVITNPLKREIKVSNLIPDDVSLVIFDLPSQEVKEILEDIKENKGARKIIVLGNDDSYKDIVEIVKMGVDKYIKKPFQDELLIRVVKELFSQQASAMEKVDKGGFITFARKVGEVWVVTILGCLEEGVINRLESMKIDTNKVVLSLNGVSVGCLNVSELDKVIQFFRDRQIDVRYIVVREKIRGLLLERGVGEELIFTNEVLAIKSFS